MISLICHGEAHTDSMETDAVQQVAIVTIYYDKKINKQKQMADWVWC